MFSLAQIEDLAMLFSKDKKKLLQHFILYIQGVEIIGK